jgi:MFS family permease
MVVQPLYGQLANIWGRRWLIIGSVVLLMIGSSVAGWVSGADMLIAGHSL